MPDIQKIGSRDLELKSSKREFIQCLKMNVLCTIILYDILQDKREVQDVKHEEKEKRNLEAALDAAKSKRAPEMPHSRSSKRHLE